MTYDRTERIRRAAILVASLDEAMAEALLRDLPPLEASRVLAELDRMDSIDAEEQADVLEEFRRAARNSGSEDGAVEFAYSESGYTPTLADQSADRPVAKVTASPAGPDPDVVTMADLLSREQTQIIAAALSRLDAEGGAAVFAALPADLQAEALERISCLAPADEEAVLEVESLLLQRVDERREHRQRAAAGVDLAHKILAKTAPERRAVLLARIPGNTRPTPGAPSVSRFAAPGMSQQALHLASTIDQRRRYEPHDSGFDAGAEWAPSGEATPDDLSAELLALSDESLIAGLQAAGEQTVQRALAASGERLLDRVARMLPRRQARKLRQMVQAAEPAQLADLRAAQHELLTVARHRQQAAA